MTTLETMRGYFVVENRLVLTYEPEGWPAGLVTAYEDDNNGLVVEHLILFSGRRLRGLLAAGLDEAWQRGYEHITFAIPHAFPLAPQLTRLARRLGFSVYDSRGGFDFWVRYAP